MRAPDINGGERHCTSCDSIAVPTEERREPTEEERNPPWLSDAARESYMYSPLVAVQTVRCPRCGNTGLALHR